MLEKAATASGVGIPTGMMFNLFGWAYDTAIISLIGIFIMFVSLGLNFYMQMKKDKREEKTAKIERKFYERSITKEK